MKRDQRESEAAVSPSKDGQAVRPTFYKHRTFSWKRLIVTVLLSGITALALYLGITFGRTARDTRTGDTVYTLAPVQPLDESGASDGQALPVYQPVTVNVTVDGQAHTLNVTEGTTVGTMLQLAALELDENDVINAELTDALSGGENFTVRRREYKPYAVTESLPYGEIRQNTSLLSEGTERLVREGENGTRRSVYLGLYEDGKLIESTLQKSTVLADPVDALYLVGSNSGAISPYTGRFTKLLDAPVTLDANNQPTEYEALLTGSTTAYTAGPGGLVCTGELAQVGIVAVDTKQIPLGSLLYIVSPGGGYTYGYAIAGDVGSPSSTFLVDLFYETEEECVTFGRRNMNIYVLKW